GDSAPDNQFVQDFISAYNYDVGNGGGQSLKAIAENPFATVDVQEQGMEGYSSEVYSKQDGAFGDSFNVVYWNPNLGLETTSGYILSPATVLEHEAGHALGSLMNTSENRNYGSDAQYDSKEEKRVISGPEQQTARANGEIPMFSRSRSDHKGLPVVTDSPISNKVNKNATFKFHNNRTYKNESFTPSYIKYAP
ncbi:hypothetical protein CHU92_00155, partial [Flavobacterium cyanobacteriorum]